MKYGINIIDGQLRAITEFVDDILPEGFKEITEERYNELLNKDTGFSTWDEKSQDFVEDISLIESFTKQAEIIDSRRELRSIISEISLAEKLGENTSVLQTRFKDLAVKYKAIANKPPFVYAGINQNVKFPKSEITLNGTATDEDGKVVSVNWSKIEGGSAKIAKRDQLKTKVTGLEPGNYRFQLTAVDNNGANATSNVDVNVKPKEAVKISVSPKEKHNISASGTAFEVNIKSNTDWQALAKGNSSVSPSFGNGNGKVRVKVYRNDSRASLLGTVEFRVEDKVTNLIWSQKGSIIRDDDDDFDDDIRCFDLESNVVMANGRSKKLKNIKIDDELLALDFSKNIPSVGKSIDSEKVLEEINKSKVKVVDFGTQTVDEYRRITLLNNTIIDVTASHPLLSSKDREEVAWLTSDDLRAGMFLVDKNGKFVEIESKRTIKETLEIGVLQVEGADNYLIQGVVVHNAQITRIKTTAKATKSAVAIEAGDIVKK